MLKQLQYKKVKAGALQYVLVISVVIAIIVFAFISLIYLQKRLQLKNSVFTQTIQNVSNGFNYLEQKNSPYNVLVEKKFSGNENEKTTLLKKKWGVYDLGIVTSTIRKERFQKIGLLAENNPKRKVLFLKDNNQALVLVGKTNIIGNAVLPRQGVKSGNIGGISYNGNKLIYGNTTESTNSLPSIKNSKHIKAIFEGNYNDNLTESFELSEGLQKTQLFTETTLLYKSNSIITLQNLRLKGNIIIRSDKKIIINSSANLKDVILIAPKISIQKNTKGNFQAFATNKIEVAKNCQLKYPTALILLENKKENSLESNAKRQILIGAKSLIKGSVLFLSEEKAVNYKPQIIISKDSEITGEIYCEKNLELLGKVYGSVYTNNFIALQFGSVYINHIYNGEINSKKLPEQYCGLIGIKTQKVAKWLY